jgi:hypothetical protein
MTFTEAEQQQHRQAFIEECRRKAWGAACHADWVSKGLDAIVAESEKLSAENEKLGEETKTLENAADSHTKDNRDQRKALQERCDVLLKAMGTLRQNMQEGQRALNGLYQSIEASLQLATHAEEWNWKEVHGTSTSPSLKDEAASD